MLFLSGQKLDDFFFNIYSFSNVDILLVCSVMIMHYFGLNCSPKISYVEALTHNETVFEDLAFKGVIKVK